MAKPIQSPGLFSSIWGNIQQILLWLEYLVDQIGNQIVLINTIKELVQTDLHEITLELQGIIDDEQNFVERAKNLRRHCVRADKVFQLWEDIRSGELKEFFLEQIKPIESQLVTAFDDFLQSGQQVGAFKTVGPGSAIINFVHKIVVAWSQVLAVIGVLKGMLPLVKAIRAKLSEFESIIMQQGNPRIRIKGPISARDGKLRNA
jgi:hypothetical protein